MVTSITHLKPNNLSLAHSKLRLIAVSPTVSVQTALDLMYKNKITSLPIFSHNNTTIVSIVNLFDILIYLVADSGQLMFSVWTPTVRVTVSTSADCQDELLETLKLFASGIHRVLVVDYSDKNDNPWLLSQTDVISPHYTVESLGFLKNKPMVTVPLTQSALDVYRLMAKKDLGGLPIVDSEGRLQGDLCLEDLPGANLEMIEQLVLPCGDYVKKMAGHQVITPTATPDTSLKDILATMAKEDTHRVWIVDSKKTLKLIGVVTMSDIINLLCKKHH
ncbi:hypothetical protein F4703DRAFT_1899917 [Phycomyces blakesleeanus]